MKTLNNEPLKNYTNIRIGGTAKNFYMPESTEELIDLINQLKHKKYHLISGGSNLLINDKKTFENVIHMKKVDQKIEDLGNGIYYVGASVPIQKLLVTINKAGFGGIEYLYSVPAYVGGAIAMNAGRGHTSGLAISDYIDDIYVLEKGIKKVLKPSDCSFSYRESIFKTNDNLIVIGATFKFKEIDTSKNFRKERIQWVKDTQDTTGFNCGSLFREKNLYIMHFIKFFHPGYKDGVTYSKKTANWLINQGEGTYGQATKLINKAVRLHKLLGLKIKLEVIKWD